MRTVLILILSLPVSSLAETAYVTDNLRLGLHQAQDTSDRAFRTLESGQQVEILSRDRNYARVQLPDGTLGYVKAAYLVFDKPAKLIVAETQNAYDALQKEMDDLKKAVAAPAATIAELKQEIAEKQSALDQNSARLEELNDENETYRKRFEQFKHSLPFSWVVGAMGGCLLAGFLVGLWWIDYRSRRRHGGIRIY